MAAAAQRAAEKEKGDQDYLKGLAAGAADLGRGPKNIKNRIFNFFIKSAFSGVWWVKTDWKSCKT